MKEEQELYIIDFLKDDVYRRIKSNAFASKRSRQAPPRYGKPTRMVMLRENQLCLETWLDDLSSDPSGRRTGRPLRKRSARNVSIELSKEDLRRLNQPLNAWVPRRVNSEHALESAIVAMEELDD